MVLGSIVGKIGLPIAIIVGAGLILAKFKDPIIGAVSSGAQTIGQTLTEPLAGLTKGLNEGFKNVPDAINIKFPFFDFGFFDQIGSSSVRSKSSPSFRPTENTDNMGSPIDFSNAKSIVQDACGNVFVDGVLKTGSGVCNRQQTDVQNNGLFPFAFGEEPTMKKTEPMCNCSQFDFRCKAECISRGNAEPFDITKNQGNFTGFGINPDGSPTDNFFGGR